MKNKTCGECKWFNKIVGIHCTWHEIEMHPNEEACGDFEPPSVFDHITQSVEALAEKLVYIIRCEEDPSFAGWTSNVVQSVFETKPEALAETIEELKKEYKK
jgi:hypothetical protein